MRRLQSSSVDRSEGRHVYRSRGQESAHGPACQRCTVRRRRLPDEGGGHRDHARFGVKGKHGDPRDYSEGFLMDANKQTSRYVDTALEDLVAELTAAVYPVA